MSPFVVLMLGLGALLLWYAFTGTSPAAMLKAIVASGSTKAKSTPTTGEK